MIIKTIQKVDWDALVDLHSLAKDDAVKLLLRVGATSPTVLPQVMALLNSTVIMQRNATNGLVDITATLSEHIKKIKEGRVYFSTGEPLTFNMFKGIMAFLTYPVRGTILPVGTVQIHSTRYAANVPLFFSAFKELRGLGYEEWDWENCLPSVLSFTLDERCASIVQLRVEGAPEFTVEELTDIRDNAAKIKSGARAGAVRSAVSITTAYGANSYPTFQPLSSLAKVLLIQTWIFIPSLRHSLGLYSLTNLDSYPKYDLGVSEEVFIEPQKAVIDNRLPWEL